MQIQFPDYSFQPLEAFTVCALIKKNKNPPKLDEKYDIEVRFESSGEPVWMKLIINEKEELGGVHIHIDTMRESAFHVDHIPTQSVDISHLGAKLEEFSGCSLGCSTSAKFKLPIDDVGQENMISVLKEFSFESDDKELRLSKATFSIKPGPVSKISWMLSGSESERTVTVDIHGKVELDLNDQYLSKCLAPLQSALQSFIMN